MLKNHLKVSVRNILQHKFYSILNIAGLALGIACVLFLLLYIQDELSYDKYNENADRIFKVSADMRFQGNDMITAQVGPSIGRTLQNDYPEVEAHVRIADGGNYFVEYGNKKFKESHIYFADSSLCDVLTVNLIRGNPKSILLDPYIPPLSSSI